MGELVDERLRRQLEPLLQMFPTAVADLRATGDERVRPLADELLEIQFRGHLVARGGR